MAFLILTTKRLRLWLSLFSPSPTALSSGRTGSICTSEELVGGVAKELGFDSFEHSVKVAKDQIHRLIKEPYLVCEGNSFIFAADRVDFNQALSITKQRIVFKTSQIVSVHKEIVEADNKEDYGTK